MLTTAYPTSSSYTKVSRSRARPSQMKASGPCGRGDPHQRAPRATGETVRLLDHRGCRPVGLGDAQPYQGHHRRPTTSSGARHWSTGTGMRADAGRPATSGVPRRCPPPPRSGTTSSDCRPFLRSESRSGTPGESGCRCARTYFLLASHHRRVVYGRSRVWRDFHRADSHAHRWRHRWRPQPAEVVGLENPRRSS